MLLRSALIALFVLGVSSPAQAELAGRTPTEDYAITMADALFARPIALAATAVGAAVWGVTLPLTAWSEGGTGYDFLVRAPARATFTRCLGCPAGANSQ